jgi:hypothetical protein
MNKNDCFNQEDRLNKKISQVITTNLHSFPGCKHLSIVATHRDISGETVQYTLCVAFPFGLPGGPIVLEGFCWKFVKYEPG